MYGRCHADRSDAVRFALQRLIQQHHIDHIIFAARDGLGFRAIQAKRARLAFESVRLIVRLDTCSAWLRDQERRWPTGMQDLEIDFAERYSFEHADGRIAANQELLDFVAGIGWKATNDVYLESDDDSGRCYSDYSVEANQDTGLEDSDLEQAQPLVTLAIPHYNLGRYLPDALASVAAQTYPNLEVLVIDDGSTDSDSLNVFDQMQSRYPSFRFLRQRNAGISATRNRGLREARGTYFIPIDADNLARADMVERFVSAIQANPEVGAMTCYFLAFKDGESLKRRQHMYACRPTGGPLTLASLRNVYGDANAIFRTATFREVGGYEIDRDTSFEDWEAFVKLVHAGLPVGVIPDHLFFYRYRETGFSRVTDGYRNHQRVLRQFLRLDGLPLAERAAVWNFLVGSQLEGDRYRSQWRHRMADRLHGLWKKSLLGPALVKCLLQTADQVREAFYGQCKVESADVSSGSQAPSGSIRKSGYSTDRLGL